MKIKKGDTVLIISGKDRSKKGKIIQVFPKENRILVEGLNLKKKHQRPRKTGEKGQIMLMPGPIPVSNVKLVCSKCGKATRVGYKIISNIKNQKPSPVVTGRGGRREESSLRPSKIRICKKCGQEI